MKKSCYAIKQTKIERFILSPCLSNKDSLAKDRVSVCFLKIYDKKKKHMANKKQKTERAPECKMMTVQVSRTIRV